MLRRLTLHPFLHANLLHFAQITDDILMVADSVDDMNFAECDQSLTRKFPAFKAIFHTVFLGAGPESRDAFDAVASYFFGIATVAVFRIIGAGSAE